MCDVRRGIANVFFAWRLAGRPSANGRRCRRIDRRNDQNAIIIIIIIIRIVLTNVARACHDILYPRVQIPDEMRRPLSTNRRKTFVFAVKSAATWNDRRYRLNRSDRATWILRRQLTCIEASSYEFELYRSSATRSLFMYMLNNYRVRGIDLFFIFSNVRFTYLIRGTQTLFDQILPRIRTTAC